MGIEPFLIASTVRATIGQRLVRRINQEECEQYSPNADEIKQLEKVFNIGPSGWKQLFEYAKAAGAKINYKSPQDMKLWRPKAKLEKNQSGYKGRLGIYEVLDNNTEIQKMIVANATSDSIQQQAVKDGMVTMHVDGLVKAIAGLTSVEEILRVTRE